MVTRLDEEIVNIYREPEGEDSERVLEKQWILEKLSYSQLGMTFVFAEGHLVKLKVGGPRLPPGV
jgi:hypothetical protein